MLQNLERLSLTPEKQFDNEKVSRIIDQRTNAWAETRQESVEQKTQIIYTHGIYIISTFFKVKACYL